MDELASDRLMPILRSLRTAYKQLECAQDSLSDATDSLRQLIGEVGLREYRENDTLVLRSHEAATTRVTNSHEPARGVNTQRVDDRLKGKNHE